MFRNYTPKEAEFLGKELADFIINSRHNGIIPDEEEVCEFMSAAYGVPKQVTKQTLKELFPQNNGRIVFMFFD